LPLRVLLHLCFLLAFLFDAATMVQRQNKGRKVHPRQAKKPLYVTLQYYFYGECDVTWDVACAQNEETAAKKKKFAVEAIARNANKRS